MSKNKKSRVEADVAPGKATVDRMKLAPKRPNRIPRAIDEALLTPTVLPGGGCWPRGSSAEDADECVVQAVTLQKALHGYQPATTAPEDDMPFRSVKAAHGIYQENGVLRWHLEACAVTGLPDGAIARCCGITTTISITIRIDVRVRDPEHANLTMNLDDESPHVNYG
jgi:hypothetical protein